MDSNLLLLFKTYNYLMERQTKAIQFFQENPDRVDTHIKIYRMVVDELNHTRNEIIECGYPMSDSETLDGFNQVKFLNL